MGHHNIRFDGDPYANSGVWSPPSSRANFCEEDYVVTFYCAEFINSLTNIAYVYLALRVMYGPGSRGLFAPKWDFMAASLLFLGIGSFLFHASLRQTLEFADELSMIGIIWSMLQTTLSVRQSPSRVRLISAALAVIILGFSAFYVWSAKIIYQVIAFFVGIFALTCRTQYLYWWAQPEFPREKARDWSKRTWEAIGICVVGYILWHIDLEFCAALRDVRQRVGLPWAWAFELHGWWHILTAIGADRFMSVAREVREESLLEEKKKT